MKPEGKLTRHRDIAFFTLLCWVTYFSTYFGRYSFTSTISEMLESGAFSKSQLGLISGVFFVAYAVGQLVSGALGDILSARHLIGGGLLISALCNLGFALASHPGWMMVIWACNGVAQSMIWPPMVRQCADWLQGNQCVQACVQLASTAPAGMIAAYLLSGLLLRRFSWHSAFFVGAVSMGAMAFLWMLGMGALQRRIVPSPAELAPLLQHKTPAPALPFLPLVLGSGLIAFSLASLLNGALRDGVTTWVPTYLVENFGLSASRSTLLTTLLPLVNLSGVHLANAWNRRLRNEAVTAGVFFGIAFLGLVLMLLLGSLGAAGAIAGFAVATTAMTGANTALIVFAPFFFKNQGKVSTVTGFLNALVHLGSALSGTLFGFVSQMRGWEAVRLSWCVLALLGVFACLAGRRQWQAFRK